MSKTTRKYGKPKYVLTTTISAVSHLPLHIKRRHELMDKASIFLFNKPFAALKEDVAKMLVGAINGDMMYDATREKLENKGIIKPRRPRTEDSESFFDLDQSGLAHE